MFDWDPDFIGSDGGLGIPKLMALSQTIATEIISSTDKEIVFKLRQEYRPKRMPAGKAVDSLVSLAL